MQDLISLTEPYDFIVKLDGDVTFEPNYFESLFNRFCSDPQLGIAGGGLYERPDGKTWILYTAKDQVRGCTKVYRRECFERYWRPGSLDGMGRYR